MAFFNLTMIFDIAAKKTTFLGRKNGIQILVKIRDHILVKNTIFLSSFSIVV